MFKQRRGVKCFFLIKFVSFGVDKGVRDSFVLISEVFEVYCVVVVIWIEGDSLYGQIKYFIKRKVFDKVSF